jgi:cell division septum initiation protein DivIVA
MTESTSGPGDGLDRTQPEGLTGILDALTDAVTHARAMPMSSSVLVNRAELLDLLEQARDVLPRQLTRADDVLADAAAARGVAQAQADAILVAARARSAELVDAEHVTGAAIERAREIVAQAEEVASGLRRDADDYCDRRLADFEIDLGKVLTQVHAGRAKLAGRLEGEDLAG